VLEPGGKARPLNVPLSPVLRGEGRGEGLFDLRFEIGVALRSAAP